MTQTGNTASTGNTVHSDGSFGELIDGSHILICCGSGGVGKTTTAAVLALEGARRGRSAMVVTIDPARRLANALGLESLSNEAHEIDRSLWDPEGTAPPTGRLFALMLDTKSTFDHLVNKYAGSPEQAEEILRNRFYKNVSGFLSGTQEYMAMEKLHELHEEGGYDLIVIDTPPTRNALDFLDAPRRLTRMLENRIFRLLMMPTRLYLRAATFAVQTFLRTVSKVVGSEVIDDIVTFFRTFEGMEEGFRQRAHTVDKLLNDSKTSFILITSPRRDALEEGLYFTKRLAENNIGIDGLIVNRIHPRFGEERPEGLDARAATLVAMNGDSDGPGARLATLYRNLADFEEVGDRERSQLSGLQDSIGSAKIASVPFLSVDVCDFSGLDAIAEVIFDRSSSRGSRD